MLDQLAKMCGGTVVDEAVMTPHGVIECTLQGRVWFYPDGGPRVQLGRVRDGVQAIATAYLQRRAAA